MKQTEPNIHCVLRAIRQLEEHPAVKAYISLLEALKLGKMQGEQS
jgi:hypothetical protein